MNNFSKNIKNPHAFSETNEVWIAAKNKGNLLVYAFKKWQKKDNPKWEIENSKVRIATGGVLQKKVFSEILQNSQENTCARD